MQKISRNGRFYAVLAVSILSFNACAAQNNMHPYAKTNQMRGQNKARVNHNSAQYGATYTRQARYNTGNGKSSANRYGRAAQQSAPAPGPLDMFQRWVDYEPQYTLYPGDQIDVVVQSAPELSRTLTVGPDGRITMPMISPIMAAGRSIPYIQSRLKTELAKQLRDPTLAVTSRAFAPQQIFVGGEVGQQGTYTMSGPIGSLEAVIMAGGFLPSAKTKDVAILRRAPNGGWMARTVNHKNGMRNIRNYADNIQLRRGDVIFIPRNTLAEIGVFMQAFRNTLPIDLSYNLGNGVNGN
ncbi:MAG: polysaccharide export protein [Robiginitomaculum sp.]|nr:MAG: polysaccharide export protein [Robiginitomaculum sp.]